MNELALRLLLMGTKFSALFISPNNKQKKAVAADQSCRSWLLVTGFAMNKPLPDSRGRTGQILISLLRGWIY